MFLVIDFLKTYSQIPADALLGGFWCYNCSFPRFQTFILAQTSHWSITDTDLINLDFFLTSSCALFCFVLHSFINSCLYFIPQFSFPRSYSAWQQLSPHLPFLTLSPNPNNQLFLIRYHHLFLSLLPPSPLSSLYLSGFSHSSAEWQRSWMCVCLLMCAH